MTSNPELAKEWHPVKNGTLTPQTVKAKTELKVWWLCPAKGHEYQASLSNRNRNDGKSRGCPYCAGRKDLSKESLAIRLPILAKEWDWEKNGKLTPKDISTKSNRRVWWRCEKGHQWQATVIQRIRGKKNRTRNCHICNDEKSRQNREHQE